MIRMQHVDKGKCNKCLLKASVVIHSILLDTVNGWTQ